MTKKFLSLLLALLLLVPTLASCNGGGSGDGDGTKDVQTGDTDSAVVTDGEGEDTAEETLSLEELYPDPFADEITPDFYLVEDGVSDYVIVHAADASDTVIRAASELQSYI
ncbi:MAG: hypothetical protein IJC98_03205, partial [Clostridia bacterium]|nr:hypothetical protein [Clostridia bacterium]